MGFGTSLGTSHEDEISYVMDADARTDKQRSDQSEMNVNETSGDFQSRFYATDQNPANNRPRVVIRTPSQAPTEPTDALESPASTEIPENTPETNSTADSAYKYIGDALYGTGKNDIRPAIQRGIQSVIDMVKYPGDVMSGAKPPPFVQDPDTGEIHPSYQAIEWATNTAATMIGAPAPLAAKVADGTLGSFMGVKSATIDKTALYKAQELEMNGAGPSAIHEATGTFRGADGRWRQEIDDSKSSLKDSAFQKNTIIDDSRTGGEVNHTITLKGQSIPKLEGSSVQDLTNWFKARQEQDSKPKLHLPDVLDHPELYKAYPDLKAVRVEPLPRYTQDNTNIQAHFSGDGPMGTIRLRDDLNPEYARSVILHEVQHKIQDIEGFAKGGNADMFLPKELPAAEKLLENAKAEVIPQIVAKGFPEGDINRLKWMSTLEPIHKKEMLDLNPAIKKLFDRAEEAGVLKQIQNIGRSEDLLKNAKDEAFEKYKRLMGEVEARNVQARMDFDKFQRAYTPPKSTEPIPRYQQIEKLNKS